jgi:PIN domain nuclease of toxin-antitoxin system
MNNLYLIDTHTLFWYLTNSPKLSATGRDIFQRAFAGEINLILSPIVLLELYGLARKVSAPFDFATELALFEQPPFRIEPITTADLYLLDRLSVIPELHDRLIAATAYRISAPILTRDPLIAACDDITCVW